MEEQDGGGVGGSGVHLSPQIHKEYTFRHRSACRTAAERGQEYLTTKRIYKTMHGNRGKIGELVGLDPHLVGGRTEAGV